MFVRSNKSVKSISLCRISYLIPIILFGVYKNGISLYLNKNANFIDIFKSLKFIGLGILIALIVNFIFEVLIKRKDNSLSEKLFSSFLIEYGIILGSICSVNTNILIYSIVLLVGFIFTKLINNKINIVCLLFLIIYFIMSYNGGFSFCNSYEVGHTFNFDLLDYLLGNYPGGYAATSIMFIAIALIGLEFTNNNKTIISLYSIVTYLVIQIILSIILKGNMLEAMFLNNSIYLLAFVSSNYQTSPYTKNGMKIYGVIVGLLGSLATIINPEIGLVVTILFVGIIYNIIDFIRSK